MFAVLSIVNVFGGNGPSMVDKAVAALAHPKNAILHMKVVGTESDKSGGDFTSTGVETGAAENGLTQIYDLRRGEGGRS